MKILMVCLGNICRSPLAEGILRRKVEEASLPWEIDSAGTGNWHVGEQPDRRAIEVAQHHGIDIRGLRARRIRPEDLQAFDRVFVMDSANYEDVLRIASSDEEQLKVEFIMNMSSEEADVNVPDPYWDNDGFERVFHMLDQACEGIVHRLA